MTKIINIQVTTVHVFEIEGDAFVDPWDAHEVMDAADHHRGVRLLKTTESDYEVTFVYDYSTKEEGAQHG